MFRTARWLALTVIVVIAGLVMGLWVEHCTALTLPKPTGRFAIGRNVAEWRDANRELLIWMWYPTENDARGSNEYLPAATRSVIENARPRVINFLTRDLANVHGNAVWNAHLLPGSYPVLLMRGGASSPVWNYAALAEDLASHGYVVVGVDAAYLTGIVVLPDGRVIRQRPANDPERCIQRSGQPDNACAAALVSAWSSHLTFALDRLAAIDHGEYDLSRAGVFGHSFGGAQALQFCHDDARCKAGVDIDGAPLGAAVRDGVRQPFLFLLSDHTGEPGSTEIIADVHAIYDRLPAGRRRLVVIPGANHFAFSDDGALLKSGVFRLALRVFGRFRIDSRRHLAITRDELRGFFDVQLPPRRKDSRTTTDR